MALVLSLVSSLRMHSRKQKARRLVDTGLELFNGRDGGIRTRDPLHPMQVRYQAALRPD